MLRWSGTRRFALSSGVVDELPFLASLMHNVFKQPSLNLGRSESTSVDLHVGPVGIVKFQFPRILFLRSGMFAPRTE